MQLWEPIKLTKGILKNNFSWFPTKFNVHFQNMKKKMFFDRNYKI